MPRSFNGTSDRITLAVGANNFTAGASTFAAIVKSASDTSRRRIMSCNAGGYSLDKSASDLIEWTDAAAPTLNIKVADGWVLVAATKAAGTVAPRFHKYVFSSRVHSHEAGVATAGDKNGGTNVWIGQSAAASFFWSGEIAALGIWNAVLTDSQIEALAVGLTPWLAVPPTGLWLLDQGSTGQLVNDLTGRGANESSKSGTSVGSSCPWTPGGVLLGV